MTDHEQTNFETALRGIKPAKPPDELIARLREAWPKDCSAKAPRRIFAVPVFFRIARWGIPALAVALVSAVIWSGNFPPTSHRPRPTSSVQPSTAAVVPALKANDVRIDEELISSFDTIARLPDGQPVRFRVRNWMDQVTLSDKTRGLVIESRTPRVEVVAVRFETY